MNSHFENICRWHAERDIPVGASKFDDPQPRERRARLIAEEFCEAMEALGLIVETTVFGVEAKSIFFHRSRYRLNPKPIEFLDALADLDFVCDGSAVEFGWDMDEARRRVQVSNDTKPKERDENGKIIKGANFVPPDLRDLVYGSQS